MYLLKLEVCNVVDWVDEAKCEVRAGQAHDEVVTWLSQLMMSHHRPTACRLFSENDNKNIVQNQTTVAKLQKRITRLTSDFIILISIAQQQQPYFLETDDDCSL